MFGYFQVLFDLAGTSRYFKVHFGTIDEESKCLAGLCSLLVTHIWQVAAGRFSEGTKEGEEGLKRITKEKKYRKNKSEGPFLATLVALHLTPVSE